MSLPVLKTSRLTLRQIEEGDAAGLHTAYGDAEAMRFWSFPPLPDVAETLVRIRRSIATDAEWHGMWAIVTRDGRFVGMINYHHRETWNRRLELGWILAPTFWRQGLMREAVTAVVAHCFDAMDVHRIEAVIEPDNAASRRLAERLGFRQEGGLIRDRLCVEGRFRGVLMYGLLATDPRG